MDNQTPPTRDTLLSISLVLLACSIAYFSYSLIRISQHIPSILAQVNNINKQIDHTVEKLDPLLLLAPTLMSEVSNIRELIPGVLTEVEAVRATVPSILERVDNVDAQINTIQQDLPEILKTVDGVTAVTHEANKNIAKIIPLVPDVLSEVEKTRNEIPSYLTRVEGMVENAKDISEEAGMGAVTGFFKGIIATPFELIKGTEERIRANLTNEKLLTEQDFKLVSEAVGRLLGSDQLEATAWENPASGNKGEVTLIRSFKRQSRECRVLLLSFKAKDGSEDSVNKDVCLNDDGKWVALE